MPDSVSIVVNCSEDHKQLNHKLNKVLETQYLILELLGNINQKEDLQMTDLSALTDEVQRNTSVDTSAIALLNGLSQQLRDLSTDPAAIQALADELDSSSSALASAVSANTPVAAPPVDTPPADGSGDAPVDTPPADGSGDAPVDNPPADGSGDAPVAESPVLDSPPMQ